MLKSNERKVMINAERERSDAQFKNSKRIDIIYETKMSRQRNELVEYLKHKKNNLSDVDYFLFCNLDDTIRNELNKEVHR